MVDDTIKQKQIQDLKTDLSNANEIVNDEKIEKKKQAAELVIAKKEVAFQRKEKGKRVAELIIVNKELASQNKEKEKQAAELVVVNKELASQKKEKGKRAAELVNTKKELASLNKEKQKLAAELVKANKKIVIQANLINAQTAETIEKQLLEKTLMCIGDAVIATDIQDNIRLLNKVAETMTGWTRREVFRKPIRKVYNIIDDSKKKKGDDTVKKVFNSGQIHQQDHPRILIRKDGKEILIEDTTALILNEQNQPLGVVIVFRDYTEKWERLSKIEYLSFHDEVTGLYNRRFYEEELKRLDIERNLPLSLIMGDVNGLKLINDSFGHRAGDELIRKAAQAISEGCRVDDIAVRIGGDEFIIVLPKTDAADAALVIERIKNNYKMEEVNGLEISISFGTETKVDGSQDINDIYKTTEKQMYRHKTHESSSIKKRTIDIITKSLFEKSRREMTHSKQVSALGVALAKKMAFSKDHIHQMKLLGLMHDIGKIGISDKILNKKAKLDDEYDEIKKHPEIGYRILSSVNEFSGISDFVLSHHERWDGKGYPRGLKGEEIPIQSRIIALAESYDAMINGRTQKTSFSKEEAIAEIKRCSGTQFDPNLVKVFIEQVLLKDTKKI